MYWQSLDVAKRSRFEQPEVAPRPEQLSCIVLRSTPDGYAVGLSTVAADSVEWLTPTHVREHHETRPKDDVLRAEKWVNEDGSVTLKPKRVAKGAPTLTVVGTQVVFGEALDAMAHRAKGALKAQVAALLKSRKSHWRHLCAAAVPPGALPLWRPTPHGEACAQCGAAEGGKKASAA